MTPMHIHREGVSILLSTLVVLLLGHFLLLKYYPTGYRAYLLFTVVSTLLYVWLIYFFRDPQRTIVMQEKMVLAPADGKIVAIQEVTEDEYLHDRRIQVSIYMSPLNVHVNRNPITGIIKFFKYHPGKYLVAWHPKSSTKNERTTTVVENEQGVPILFRQIAGFLARRIKFYPQEGDQVQQGSEFGFIKLGSRVDVFLPLDAQLKVSMGEKVKGGISVIAAL